MEFHVTAISAGPRRLRHSLTFSLQFQFTHETSPTQCHCLLTCKFFKLFEMVLVQTLRAAVVAGLLFSAEGAARRSQDKQKPLDKGPSSSSDPFNDELADFVGDVMNRWKIPGMSVAVVDGDHVYSKAVTELALCDVSC